MTSSPNAGLNPQFASGARGLSCFALLLTLAACTQDAAPSPAATPVSSGSAYENLIAATSTTCLGRAVEGAISRLDSALAVQPRRDAFAVRAGCLRQRYARDSVRADAEAAFADLGRAIEASGEGESIATDALYNQRAFVRLTLNPDDLTGLLADLDEAVALAPTSSVHRSDRSVARAMVGDTAGAREDLEAMLSQPSLDSALAADLRQRLASLE